MGKDGNAFKPELKGGLHMKRKSLICVLAALLALSILACAAAEDNMQDNAAIQNKYMYVYTKNGKPLHMRSQPSRDATVLLDIPYGSQVKLIYEENLTWAYVRYSGVAGFVMQDYLVPNRPAAQPTPPGSNSQPGTTTGDLGTLNQEFKSLQLVRSYTVYASPLRSSGFVNLRFAPHLEAEIATICYDGHALTVMAETKSWYQVQDPISGYVGYMMKRYTRFRR